MMNIFMTGATGVIGSRALPLLLEAGHSVSGLSRSADNTRAIEKAGATPVSVSIFDRAALTTALSGHDTVINLATHIPSSTTKMVLPWAWRENDRIRRHGSAALSNAAREAGAKRFIQESFAPMYADKRTEWIDENELVQPCAYNRSTIDAERNAKHFSSGGRTAVILRFAALYGPDSFFGEMVDTVKKGFSPLPGDRNAYFSALAQDDAATATVAALALDSGIYNVAEDDPMSRGEFVNALANAADLEFPKPFPPLLEALGGSVVKLLSRSLRISNRKLRESCDWKPRYPNAVPAFPELVSWYRTRTI